MLCFSEDIIKRTEMWNGMFGHQQAYVYVHVFGRLAINQLTLVCPNSTASIFDVHRDLFCVEVLSFVLLLYLLSLKLPCLHLIMIAQNSDGRGRVCPGFFQLWYYCK